MNNSKFNCTADYLWTVFNATNKCNLEISSIVGCTDEAMNIAL